MASLALTYGLILEEISKLSNQQKDFVLSNFIEILSTGNTTNNEDGNFKFEIVNNRLQLMERINNVWEIATTFGSVISDYFILNERYSTLSFNDPRYPDINKNALHLSTKGDCIGVGDSRLDGIFLNGKTILHDKMRLINDNINDSLITVYENELSNTTSLVNEISFTFTSPNNDDNNTNLIYEALFDIKEDCKADLQVFNHGETTDPIYQTIKLNELEKGLGYPIAANSLKTRLLKLLYMTPGNQYDIKIYFQEPTLVGGYIDTDSVFHPKIGLSYLKMDDFELYDEDNLTGEKIRNFLELLKDSNRLASNNLYHKINTTNTTLVIPEEIKDNYINGLLICENSTGNIDVVLNENLFSIGDKLTIKQSSLNPGAPTCRFVPFNGQVEHSSSITLYAGQSCTVQCVAENEFLVISKNNNVDDIFVDMQDPTGLIDVDSVTLSFDNASRTLSLSPIGAWYEYYAWGLKHRIDTTKTITIPNVTDKYYFYLNSNQELQYINSFNMDTLFYNNAYVSVVYWSAEDSKRLYFGKETHGINMQGKVHEYLHTNFGARYKSGLGLFNFQTDGEGISDWDARFQYDSGVIYDEDIQHNIPASSNPLQIPIFYREGINSIKRKEPNSFPLIGKNDIIITTRPKYNQNINGTWQLTEVGVNDFWLVHYFATNDIDYPVIGWVGNNVYENAVQARDNAYDEINTLNGLPFEEFVKLGSVIFKTNSFTNEPNAIIVSTEDGGNYIDFRGSATVEGVTNVAEHGSLTGLTLPNAHPATSINVDITNLNGNLFGAGNTSQEIFDAIDNLSIEEQFSEIRIIDTGLPKEVRTVKQLAGTHTMRLHMRNITDFDTLNLELNGLQIASGIPKVEGYSTFEYAISEVQATNGTNLSVDVLPVEITVVTGTPQIYNSSVLQKNTDAEIIADGVPFAFDFRFLDLYRSMERVEDLLGNHFCVINLLNNIDLIEEVNIQMTIGSVSRDISHDLTSFTRGRNTFQASITQENVDAFLTQLPFDNIISIAITVNGNGSNISFDGGEIHIDEFDNKSRHVMYNVKTIDSETDTIEELSETYPVETLPDLGILVAFNHARTLDNLGAFGISNRFNLNLGQGALIHIDKDESDNYIFRLISPYYDGMRVLNEHNNFIHSYDGGWQEGLSLSWGKIVGSIGNQTDLVDYINTQLNGLFESSDNVDTYEDNDYLYTIVGIDNEWYAKRMSKVDPFTETRYPTSGNDGGLKPTTLVDVQGLTYV